MDKCREEFEQYIRDQSAFTADFQIGCNGQYKSDLMHFMFVTWQHQQAKVEELQRRNQMLNDNIKEQGQKLVYQNEVIETQAEKLLGLRDEKAELQKRVNQALELCKKGGALSACLAFRVEQALKGEG
ncbi:hypothetical protein ACWB3A_12440 [Acinetobacter baumannii]